jgi:transposase
MMRICNEQYSEEMELLCTIPGVSMISAIAIIAETGADMSIFETSGKLTGWAGLRPRNDESAGKYKSTVITKGNKYLKSILVQVAWAASRTKGSFFKETFARLSIRKSKKKALVAVARKILVVVWHLITEKREYNPALLPVYDPAKLSKKVKYHQKEVERIEKLLKR